MDPRTARKLVERVQGLERKTPEIRLGVITDTSPLSVAVGGSDIPYTTVKALAGTPLDVDDHVAVVRFGADLLILGRIGDGQPEAWHIIGDTDEPAFEHSWTNFDGTRTARYYKDPAGIVRLDGYIKDGTMSQPAFTLPVGYRPARNLDRACVSDTGGHGMAIVGASGGVVPTVGANTDFSLSGIDFRAEQ